MTVYVITEGSNDVLIIQHLLPNHYLRNTQFIAAKGLFRVKPLATSLILERQEPVVLFIDSNSRDLTFIDERRKNFEEALHRVSIDTSTKVIVSIPEIETIFFEYPNILSKIVGMEISEEIMLEAQTHPRVALQKLFDASEKCMNLEEFLNLLSEEDIKQMQKYTIIQDFISFVETLEKSLQFQ